MIDAASFARAELNSHKQKEKKKLEAAWQDWPRGLVGRQERE